MSYLNYHNREMTFCISRILKVTKTNLAMPFLVLALLISVNLASPAIAQSGSRSSASTGASVLNAPAPNLTPPPVSTQDFGLPTQGISQVPDHKLMPQQFAAQSQASGSGSRSSAAPSSSGSIGIPAAAVTDSVFEINDPNSIIAIDHSAWDQFLSCYLITDQYGLNRIRYRDVSIGDRQQLENYLTYLQSVDVRTLNRDEQLAYWFNLYNAKIVDVILAHYPIRSIRQIKQKFTDFVGPFDDAGAVTVLGKSLSLSDVESGIVRPVYNDPRVHFALNCGSYGCPNLAETAWTAENLDARLNGAAIDFINSGRAIKSSLFGLRLSKIFKWYKDDFGGTDEAVITYLQQYANPTTCGQLQNARISGHFYDWSLNDAKIKRPRFLEPFIR